MAHSYQHLPDLLARVADAAGEDAALLVAKEWGGQRIYLPQTLRTNHRLVQLLGRTRAQAVIDELGYGQVLVPLGPMADDAAKRQEIRKLLSEGVSQSTAARRAHVHVRTVERIAKSMRSDTKDRDQISLF